MIKYYPHMDYVEENVDVKPCVFIAFKYTYSFASSVVSSNTTEECMALI